LLIYSELNTAKRAAQLNRNSVLMKGAEHGGVLRWIGRALDRYV
jgi:hypothetical protein